MTEGCANCKHLEESYRDKDSNCFWCTRMWWTHGHDLVDIHQLMPYFRPAEETEGAAAD